MSLETTLARIERKLDALSKVKPSWVKATTILELTGWDAFKLRQARVNKTISFKKEGKSYFYDLNSIHPYLIKK